MILLGLVFGIIQQHVIECLCFYAKNCVVAFGLLCVETYNKVRECFRYAGLCCLMRKYVCAIVLALMMVKYT